MSYILYLSCIGAWCLILVFTWTWSVERGDRLALFGRSILFFAIPILVINKVDIPIPDIYLYLLIVALEECLKLFACTAESRPSRALALGSLFGIWELIIVKIPPSLLGGPGYIEVTQQNPIAFSFIILLPVIMHFLTILIYLSPIRSRIIQFSICFSAHLYFNWATNSFFETNGQILSISIPRLVIIALLYGGSAGILWRRDLKYWNKAKTASIEEGSP